MMDRREFFRACAVLLGSSVLPLGCSQGGSGSGAALDTQPVNSDHPVFSKQQFENLPATVFSVNHDMYGVVDLTLTQVDDEVFSAGTEQFSVCLTGPDAPLFSEGSYPMYNDTLGNIELYLQPGESQPGQQSYRAIFNLIAA